MNTSTQQEGSGRFNRRRLLAGTAALAVGATGLAAGCSSDGASGGTSEGGGAFKPPTYTAFPGVEPDIAPGENGVPAAYLTYPKEPIKRDGFPLDIAKPVSMLLQGIPLDVTLDKSTHMKLMEKDVGGKLEIVFVSSVDYKDKFQVTMASGDLPDLVQMMTVPQLPKLLENTFTDLTDHLSGDKIKDYPGLASIPTDGWEVAALNGRLWGIPQMRPAVGRIMSTRGDLLEKKGIDPNPKLSSGEDFIDLLKEVSDKKSSVFALGADPADWLLPAIQEMMGSPNGWRDDGGSFVNELESEEMKAALEQVAAIWKAGYLHPNGFSDPGGNFDRWQAGTTSLYLQSFSGWAQFGQDFPQWNMGAVSPPKWDGGGTAVKHLGPAGYGAYIGIRKQDSDERLQEILRVVDYIASPFGTQEFLDVNFGVEGEQYNFKGSEPVPTEKAAGQRVRPIQYAGSQLYAQLYMAGQPDVVKTQHEYLSDVMPGGVQNASYGLFSETSVTKGATASLKVQDAKREIIQGRKPLSEWDAVVDEWKKAAGDAMRGEYEEAAANAS